ncbi:U-box domain-containing protein 63 [Morella rubra]|uniref:U-box domain-containing protein 63 n=1 Tax=Morella rubra TaxID=262757 RepID=A0A6A1V060_9ROSI|nr:U-box domain-containing protein 63 [Morella rubra]
MSGIYKHRIEKGECRKVARVLKNWQGVIAELNSRGRQALRAAAAAVKHEDDRRLFHNAALRKRRKEMGDQTDPIRRPNRENGDVTAHEGFNRGVQYPFSVNEKVVIKGNRRTPDKFVGKEAIITSQCLNGWYLLKIIGTGENVRLQYRSLRKILNTPAVNGRCLSQPIQNSS